MITRESSARDVARSEAQRSRPIRCRSGGARLERPLGQAAVRVDASVRAHGERSSRQRYPQASQCPGIQMVRGAASDAGEPTSSVSRSGTDGRRSHCSKMRAGTGPTARPGGRNRHPGEGIKTSSIRSAVPGRTFSALAFSSTRGKIYCVTLGRLAATGYGSVNTHADRKETDPPLYRFAPGRYDDYRAIQTRLGFLPRSGFLPTPR
jgi:hypothetical protein